MRLIYAYGDHDPVDDNGLFYHGPSHRGTKTVSLLSEFQVPDNLPTDIRHIEFLQRNVRIILLIQIILNYTLLKIFKGTQRILPLITIQSHSYWSDS